MNGPSRVPGLLRDGGVVVLSGRALWVVLEALLVCIRFRRQSGLSISEYAALVTELRAAVSPNGHADVRETQPVHDGPMPTMHLADAAAEIGLSLRQTRRLALQLGGRKIGRGWLVDPAAVAEHAEGQHRG